MRRAFWIGIGLLGLCCGCTPARSRLHGALSLRLLHSADIHSHLFEEPLEIGAADAARGLGALGETAQVGGGARLATALEAARRGQSRSLYLDSGDLLEGGASFPLFGGEPELRLASALGLDAAALGNHDLSLAPAELARAHRAFAGFPLLAANYAIASDSPLKSELAPWAIVSADGLSVGVIGVGFALDALGRVDGTEAPGFTPIAAADAVQSAIDWLAPSVDLLVAVTHEGLAADQQLIATTSGLDVVLGGHQHIFSDGVLSVQDCGARLAALRGCTPRPVRLLHSGAFARYLGVLELELDDRAERIGHDNPSGFEVTAAEALVVPLSSELEQAPEILGLLEPYRAELEALGYSEPVAFALADVTRAGPSGGESALGNLVCDAILSRTGADLALIASSGLRADLPGGSWSRADVARALPFADPLVVVWLTGSELLALLQSLAARANDCQANFQIAGFELRQECSGGQLELTRHGRALDPDGIYALATTAFLADGGSGFGPLSADRTLRILDETPETALLAELARKPACPESALPCVDPAQLLDGRFTLQGG